MLERYQFDGELLRDDVAEICMKIDDALTNEVSSKSRESIDGPIVQAA